MIEELRIRSLGVIEEATIPLGPGLTVLTGETGAGKTMVLSGVNLIMGGRADGSMLRRDADRADVDGQWLLPHDLGSSVRERIDELGGDMEDGDGGTSLLLGRSISASGRSRAFAGGRTVPASVLAEITEQLVAVHGQSDQIHLRDTRRQRELVDRFAGPELVTMLAGFRAALTRLQVVQRELDELVTSQQEREREAGLLRLGIAEIAEIEPLAGEDDDLKSQATVLAHASELVEAASRAHELLTGDGSDSPNAMDLLGLAARDLERARTMDPAADRLAGDLTRSMEALGILAMEVAAYASALDADPARLAQVEERRHQIAELKRRYGPRLDDVLSWWAASEEAVAAVDGADDRRAALESELATLSSVVRSGAEQITAARRVAGTSFGEQVTAELRELAMPDADVVVDIQTAAELADFTNSGADTVSILLAPHRGSEARALGAGASGGELSRLMLAIEVVLAGVDAVPTFIFDEVDAGIGGRVAVEVGRRLARLAGTAQVLVVTHLPQVAAFADAHIVVTKDAGGQVTASSVVQVDGEARVRELVRMLSGLEDSASGAEHASELLELAATERARR